MSQYVIAPEKKSSGVYIVTGTVALTGTQPTVVTLPCQAVLGAVVCLAVAAPPGDATVVVAVTVSGKTLLIEGYKNTSGTDPTLVDGTDAENVNYIAWVR